MKKLYLMLTMLLASNVLWAEEVISIHVEIPKLPANPYHRPYVAIWLETVDREPIETIALWVEQEDWLKDLRQWWRKMGRSTWGQSNQLDSVTGATRKPGKYELTWRATDSFQKNIVLHVESVREEGGRSYVRQDIDLTQSQSFSVSADGELGDIRIMISQL